MFGLFPCSWIIPEKKPVKSLADHHFPQRTARISAPVPEAVREPVIIEIPSCEMLRPGEEVNLEEVDRMLADMDDDSEEAKTRQILRTITMVTENLSKNISVIENASAVESDNISRKDLLKLLKGFHNFTRTIENHIKEQVPSLL